MCSVAGQSSIVNFANIDKGQFKQSDKHVLNNFIRAFITNAVDNEVYDSIAECCGATPASLERTEKPKKVC